MGFAEELSELLPDDLPNRESVVAKSSRHLGLIVEANQQFNLTRILDPREAAIKHVVDSVIPWRLFERATHVLDVGTGAGYPGMPLALVLPAVQFTLSESIGKKARFVQHAAKELEIPNIQVLAERAETILRRRPVDIVTARAVAPVERALELLGPALRRGARALLYKGPDVQPELEEGERALRKFGLRARVALRYELPDGVGSRTVVEIGG